MNELTIDFGDEASLSMGTLIGSKEGGRGAITWDFEGGELRIRGLQLRFYGGLQSGGTPVEGNYTEF